MKKTYTYKGYKYRLTDTTTDVIYHINGRPIHKIAYVYKIDGIGRMPILTSHTAVKEYINKKLLKNYW